MGITDICLELNDNGGIDDVNAINNQVVYDLEDGDEQELKKPASSRRNHLLDTLGLSGEDELNSESHIWKILLAEVADLDKRNIPEDQSGNGDGGRKSGRQLMDSTDASDALLPPAEQQLATRLLDISSSVKESKLISSPLYDLSEGSIIRLDSEEEDGFDSALTANSNSNPKFERQERLDVKKPGPWFPLNNFVLKRKESNSVATGESSILLKEGGRYGTDLSTMGQDYVLENLAGKPTDRDFRKHDYPPINPERKKTGSHFYDEVDQEMLQKSNEGKDADNTMHPFEEPENDASLSSVSFSTMLTQDNFSLRLGPLNKFNWIPKWHVETLQ